ncbi:hypothetical protein D3C73_1203670 [compost metagenome]
MLVGKRLTQRGLLQSSFIIQIICLRLPAVTLALLLGKRLAQGCFLQGFIILRKIISLLQWLVVLTGALFLFGHTLRRQLDAVGSQLTPGRNTHRVRARQFRAEALFHLRVRVTGGGKGRHKGIGGNSTGNCRRCGGCLRLRAAKR